MYIGLDHHINMFFWVAESDFSVRFRPEKLVKTKTEENNNNCFV